MKTCQGCPGPSFFGWEHPSPAKESSWTQATCQVLKYRGEARKERPSYSPQHFPSRPPSVALVSVPFLPQVNPLRVVQPPPVRPGPLQPPGESVLPWQQPLVSCWGVHAAGFHHRPPSLIYPLRQWRLVRSGAEKGPSPVGWGHQGGPQISSAPAAGGQEPHPELCLSNQTNRELGCIWPAPEGLGALAWGHFVPS